MSNLKAVSRWSLTALVFVLVSVVNPLYLAGCESGPDVSAIKADLIAELDEINGTRAFTFSHEGDDYELLIALTQQARSKGRGGESASAPRGMRFLSTAHACGTETFYQSASACSTHYALAVEGTFTLRRLGDDPATIISDVPVSGMVRGGGAELRFGGDSISIYRADGEVYKLGELMAMDLGDDNLDIAYYDYD